MSILKRKHNNNESSILIMTDLETDDIVAIYMLRSYLKDKKVIFLVGEGDSQLKKIRMEKYLKILKIEAIVLRGYSSDKKFKYDGYDIMTEKEVKDIKHTDNDIEYIKDVLKVFISMESPFIISLKPPRELIELWNDGFDKKLSKCIFAGYMGFNLRCLMEKRDSDNSKIHWFKHKLVSFMKNFKECYFYETFNAVGQNNIITEKDFSFKNLPSIIKDIMKWFNEFQVNRCKETYGRLINKTDDGSLSSLKRNNKILSQIVDNNGNQFVNADSGLILSLLQENAPYRYKSIKYDLDLKKRNAYPIFSDGNDILVIDPEDKEKYRIYQVNMMKNMLIC